MYNLLSGVQVDNVWAIPTRAPYFSYLTSLVCPGKQINLQLLAAIVWVYI